MTLPALPPDVDVAPDVAAALAAGGPVVALESTIIAHGMPHPANLDTARALEAIVTAGGAIPATIAVIGGRIKVGLDEPALVRLAGGGDVLKASTHDLPFAVAQGRDAATTVAATMRIAAMAGIRVFATGGIGGVHRGARDTFDVSADVTELGRTDVAVVCAGAKAILDLAATLEALETASVPVIAFAVDMLPAFYSRSSGLKAPLRLDTPTAIAAFLAAKWRLGLRGGVLIANPIPVEAEIPAEAISAVIEGALAAAAVQGIAGKSVTPFLLDRINAATAGRSLAANVALVKNNARLAAQIACALAPRD
jgi:pseudouridine-5'-phosphate glycosidase